MAPKTYEGLIPKLSNASGTADVNQRSELTMTVDNALAVFADGLVAVQLAKSSWLTSWALPTSDSLDIFRWMRRRAKTKHVAKAIAKLAPETTAQDFAQKEGGRYVPWDGIQRAEYSKNRFRTGSDIDITLTDGQRLSWGALDRSVRAEKIAALLAPHLGDRLAEVA